jgi:hypothetical protein
VKDKQAKEIIEKRESNKHTKERLEKNERHKNTNISKTIQTKE